MRIFLICISILYLTSCLSMEEKKAIQQIDNMLIRLDSLNKIFQSMQYDTASYIYKQTSSFNKSLKQNNFELPKNELLKQKIIIYADIEKAFKNYLKDYYLIKTSIDTSFHQLNTLKQDINNNNLSKNEMLQYTNDEKHAIDAIEKEINLYYPRVHELIKTYRKIYKDVEHYRDSLLSIKK